MKGSIYEINPTRGMVAVLTEHADFSIFELLADDPVEKEDEVQWQYDTEQGSTMLKNITQNETFEVFFQNHCVPKSQLRQQLLF